MKSGDVGCGREYDGGWLSERESTSVSGESEWTVGYTTIFFGRERSKKGETKREDGKNKMNISKVIRVGETATYMQKRI